MQDFIADVFELNENCFISSLQQNYNIKAPNVCTTAFSRQCLLLFKLQYLDANKYLLLEIILIVKSESLSLPLSQRVSNINLR